MTIQSCPVEVLDKIFEYIAYSDPKNAQVNLHPLRLTCSHFRTIAKRHFIRIVCLPNADKVNGFAIYLKNMVERGDYGNSMLPIQHLAVAGKYRIPRGLSFRQRSNTEVEAERILPAIITTAAPTLLTLTIFGVDANMEIETVDGKKCYHKRRVPHTVKFPQLRELVALEQQLIRLNLDLDNQGDNTADVSRYQALQKLYIISDHSLGCLPSPLPTLRHLRLEMLDTAYARLPSLEQTPRVQSLIIDAPQYFGMIVEGCFGRHQSRAEYESTIGTYQTFIEKICDSNDSGVVIPAPENTSYTSRRRVLTAWANAVAGGSGCWTTAWTPTVLYTEEHEDD
jgi:hypothetical protein